MRKLLIGLMIVFFAGISFSNVHHINGGYLKQSTPVVIPVGPFEKAAPDGDFVAPTISDLNATFIKADGTVDEDSDLSDTDPSPANTLTLITATTDTDYWYTLAILATNVDVAGRLDITIWDDGADAISPMVYHFIVVPSKAYELLHSGVVDVTTVLGAAPFNNTTDYVIPVPFVAGTVATYTSTTSITLDASAAATANLYKGHMIEFPSGTGMNQSAIITAYTSGRVATLAPALNAVLSTDTTYRIYPGTLNVGTVVLETPFDNSTDTVQLANDTITSAKFDESTAYPLKSADTGSTAVARTGADSDTLKTLSDQMDATDTAAEIAAAVGIYSEASNSVNATGTTKSHIVLDSALAVLTDPIYCRVLYYDADTGLYSGHLCINYNSTAQSIDIFPALKITPATADTVTIIGEYSGLLPNDITKYAPR